MGVIAIAAEVVGARVGLAASAFVPVSLGSAAGVVLCAEYVHHMAEAEGRSAAGHQCSGRVARRALTARTGDWLAGLQAISTENGAVFIEGTNVWLESSIEQFIPPS
jgi:flavin reductase (DIM6/NTAB) family NADH-FMN oxidoreductase RutF